MSQHIGIVACSAEGAALCYRTICLESADLMGQHTHPEISMHGHSLGEYMDAIYQNDWDEVARLMLSSAHKLKNAGADFLICPDNTIHLAFDRMADQSPLPWLHIVEEVASEARRRNFRRLGITGTKYTMEGEAYPSTLSKSGLEYRVPDRQARHKIDAIIFDELVNARFTTESLSYFQSVIEVLKQQGCDAVVLGCTEIPLLVSDKTSSLPTLDSTRILARAALRKAISPAQ